MLALSALAASSLAATPRSSCCEVAAGTVVKVALVNAVSSASMKQGDTFALRLAAPLIVNGRVVLRAGTPGKGEVIESEPPGLGGKPAKMVLAASYLISRRGQVPLDAMQLARPGRDNSTTSHVLGISGIVFAPLGIAGIVIHGGQVVFQPGTVAEAKVASTVTLPPLGRATRRQIAAAAALASQAADQDDTGPIAIPPPPAGQGQVVFFRAKSLMGTGQWFSVREDGKALGKLSNGAYFIQAENPGVHTYTASFEPEFKDHLKLDVDAGETYFVEGNLTGGLVVGAANLTPSGRAKFNAVAKDLKLAAAPDADKPAPAPTPVATGVAPVNESNAGPVPAAPTPSPAPSTATQPTPAPPQ